MKRLSLKSWEKLLSKYGGGPALSHDDCCRDCLIDGAQNVESADTYCNKRESFKRLAWDILCGDFQRGNYYVSRSWLQQWCKRKVVNAPSKADAGPIDAIICQHGQLMHEEASGAKRVLVPEDFWLFLYEDAASLKPDLDNHLGYLALPKDSVVCSKCCDKLSEVFSWRLFKQELGQSLKKLFSGKSMPLSLDCKYFLVPSKWISNLRNYINQAVKNSDKFETLDGAINSLICEKHSGLTERPPELIFRGGAIVPKESSAGGLTIISESDWKRFCEGCGAIETKGISAKIESINDLANAMSGSRQDLPICEDRLPNGDKVSNENGNSQIVIKTCPKVCESCIGERESCELMRKLNYCNEEIYVVLVRGKEVLPRSILEASKGFVETVRRGCKRSRMAKNESPISLKVSASTSIYQLKMMIWNPLGLSTKPDTTKRQ